MAHRHGIVFVAWQPTAWKVTPVYCTHSPPPPFNPSPLPSSLLPFFPPSLPLPPSILPPHHSLPPFFPSFLSLSLPLPPSPSPRPPPLPPSSPSHLLVNQRHLTRLHPPLPLPLTVNWMQMEGACQLLYSRRASRRRSYLGTCEREQAASLRTSRTLLARWCKEWGGKGREGKGRVGKGRKEGMEGGEGGRGRREGEWRQKSSQVQGTLPSLQCEKNCSRRHLHYLKDSW